MKRIYVREDYCVGCGLCEIYCAMAHSRYPHDLLKAFKKDADSLLPRIWFEEREALSFSVQCRHCEEPQCVLACITGALQKDPLTGMVLCNANRCVGCWTCVLACPYGALRRDVKNRKAVKCDLCKDWGDVPACVLHCPNEALVLIDE